MAIDSFGGLMIVKCDKCRATDEYEATHEKSSTEQAIEEGWCFEAGRVLCPSCGQAAHP